MTFSSTDILGVHIDALDIQAAVHTIEAWINNRESRYVCICTVHSIMEANNDPNYKFLLNHADMRTPDGMPLVWLSRLSGKSKISRVCGPDLMAILAARSRTTGHRHYFYGGAPGVATELARNLVERYPGLHVVGTHQPGLLRPGEMERAEVIGQINASTADIVWVGLGSPKQDWWIANHRKLLDAPVLIAVGAAFDFHSGRISRAPKWMQKAGLEWLFRLSQDPRRLWRRYLVYNTLFIFRVVKQQWQRYLST